MAGTFQRQRTVATIRGQRGSAGYAAGPSPLAGYNPTPSQYPDQEDYGLTVARFPRAAVREIGSG